MADEPGLKQVKENPLTDDGMQAKIVVPTGNHGLLNGNVVYKLNSLASIKVEGDCCCFMGNWVLEEAPEAGCCFTWDTDKVPAHRRRSNSISVFETNTTCPDIDRINKP